MNEPVQQVEGGQSLNRVKVLFFAYYREKTGLRQVEMDLPQGALVGELKPRLAEDYPELMELLPSALIAVNHNFAFDQDVIPAAAEIAIFPPVSGGSDQDLPEIFLITEEAIDLDEIVARISLPESGAACIFTGMVRAFTQGDQAHQTALLHYEAYQEMAELKMKQVASEIRHHWPAVQGIAIIQRIGQLLPGTPTVLIACSAAHRHTGIFEAARYGIDRLKEIVPVWKKEIGPDGQQWIEGTYQPGKDD